MPLYFGFLCQSCNTTLLTDGRGRRHCPKDGRFMKRLGQIRTENQLSLFDDNANSKTKTDLV